MAVYDQITVFCVAIQCTPISAYQCFRGKLVLVSTIISDHKM